MPDLTISLTASQGTRVAEALRKLPDRTGAMPPADATNAQLLAHARRVLIGSMIAMVKASESQNADPELDGIS